MSVSYNKLWKLLIDHKMNRGELRVAAQMSPNIIPADTSVMKSMQKSSDG